MKKKQSEIEIAKYDTLQKIVDQLEWCNYEAEAGYLKNNVAFIALKRIAKQQPTTEERFIPKSKPIKKEELQHPIAKAVIIETAKKEPIIVSGRTSLFKFLEYQAHIITLADSSRYYYLPYWFKPKTRDRIEIHSLGDLPEELVNAISEMRDPK